MTETNSARLAYSYAEAARILGLGSVQALRDLVYKGVGPKLTRVGVSGRRVLFAHADLIDWLVQHRDSTPLQPVSPTLNSACSQSARRRRGRPSVADRQTALSCKPLTDGDTA